MKAFNTYGSKCNGCGKHAEYCHCILDNKGNLIEPRNERKQPIRNKS